MEGSEASEGGGGGNGGTTSDDASMAAYWLTVSEEGNLVRTIVDRELRWGNRNAKRY